MKFKKFLTILTIILVVIIPACEKDDFVETVGVCPAVVSTSPDNLATSVPLNLVITVTFNEEMNPSTITDASITLEEAIPAVTKKTDPITKTDASSILKEVSSVAGTVSYSGVTASFIPSSPLVLNTTYIGRVTTSVKDLMGNALQVDYVWTFSTGATLLPSVAYTSPINNATGVSPGKIVTATFSVPMDPTTISATTFKITQGVTPIAGTVTYSGLTAFFTPSGNFLSGITYTATITTGAENTSGTPLADVYVWNFSTGTSLSPTVISTDPINDGTDIFLNKSVTAIFNMPMDILTLTETTFTLHQGATPIAGTVSYTGTTASFKPSGYLLSGITYTATITTGAENISGTPLANNYIWTFTTGSTTAPMVISTDPLNNTTDIILDQIITATFSETMDLSTLTESTFIVKHGVVIVDGTVTYSGSTATFTPTDNLLSGTSYTATITTGAENVSGTPLADNYVWRFSTNATIGAPGVDLGSVARFGIIAGVGISNNAGFSEIRNMDVGISPGVRSSIVGFPPAIMVNGAIYASDDIAPPGVPAMLIQAKQDLTDAYLFAEGASSPAPATVSGDLGGTTLAPGIYKSTSTLLIQSGDLTLDAQGDENAVWIFQIASDFTTIGGAGGDVILSGGAQAKNIFWQVGSSATIGDYTSFKGNVLALTSITMNSHASAEGRMLARNGAVVLTSTNIINKP